MAEEELVLYYNLSVCLSHRRQTDRQKLRHAAHIAGLPSASCMEAAHLPPTDSTLIITSHVSNTWAPSPVWLKAASRAHDDETGGRRVFGTLRLRRIGLSMKASSCSSSSCPYSRLAWLRVILHGNICSYKAPSSVLVVSGRAGGGSQHQPSLMRRRERRGWWLKGGGGWGGGCTVTNRFQGDPCSICPGRGERHGTSRQNPFKILIRSWLFCKSSSLSEIQINP